MRATVLMALALPLLVACASGGQVNPAAAGEPRKSTPSLSKEGCIFATVVDDWTPIDAEHLVLYGRNRHEVFLTQLVYPSPDLASSTGIAIVDADHDGRICGYGSDAVVFLNSLLPAARVTIRSMERIDKAQLDAILKTLDDKRRNRGRKRPVQPAP